MYDLVIKNGNVYDGTGSPPYTADIGVAGDEIVAVGQLEAESAKTVDASGLAVTPGFIDLHTHSDASFLHDATAQSKVRQGVTLELAGNCGSSFCAPVIGKAREQLEARLGRGPEALRLGWTSFGEYLDAVQATKPPLNLAGQVGHGTIRACVVGLDARAPSPEEQDSMRELVAECLDEGAMGFSTGLFYDPGNYARLEEVIDICRAVSERDKVYSTHIRDEGAHSVGLFVALNEAIEISRRTGVRLQLSHVKCVGPTVFGRAADVLKLIDSAVEEGLNVAGDQYPYTAASTRLTGAIFPRWALAGGRVAALERLADAKVRSQVKDGINYNYDYNRSPEGVVISRLAEEPRFEGMTMTVIAEEFGCDPAEAAVRLYEMGEAMVVIHAMREDDVLEIAQHPLISVGSDGSSLSTEGVLSAGVPHPRSYGTFPRFIAEYVRKHGVVSFTEAIRKMTTLPASRMGLTRRGRIAPGYAADIVALDPDTVADTATFESPHSYAVGVPHVAVNGAMVIENGEYTGAGPGKVIRDFHD